MTPVEGGGGGGERSEAFSSRQVGASSDVNSSPEQSVDSSPLAYSGMGTQPHPHHQRHQHHIPLHQQHQPAAPTYPQYVAHNAYGGGYHPPSSPTSMQHAYPPSMGDGSGAYGQPGAGLAEIPQRSISPGGTSMEAYSDPYFMSYMQGNTAPGPRYYVPATAPHPNAYPQSQYQTGVYGMQFYTPYAAQPQYYNDPGRQGAWAGSAPPSQHAWRQAPYYPYASPNPATVSPYGRGTGPRPRPGSYSNNLATASRSASTSSRTSPGSTAMSQRQEPSPGSGQTSSSDLTAGGTRITPPQALQGQGPRSEFVLWCGNVPADATVDELWAFFARPTHEESDEQGGESSAAKADHGVVSIFIIARSNCAFFNYESDAQLQKALLQFQGKSLRPEDSRCPKLVCRVRKKDDEAQAGVAGQRGRGMHVAWLKEQERKAKEERVAAQQTADDPDLITPLPRRSSRGLVLTDTASGPIPSLRAPSPESSTATPTPQNNVTSLSSVARKSIDNSSSSGSVSYASTNSSLFRHPAFRERFFILKSLRVEDLDESVKTGTWATQSHNEAVLDQAYRNSEIVYLIFSANQSGGFYGYARMASVIHTPDRHAATVRPTAIPEHDENEENGGQITTLGLPSRGFDVSTASPLQMTPSTDTEEEPVLPSQTSGGGGGVESSIEATTAVTPDEGKTRSKSTLKPSDAQSGSNNDQDAVDHSSAAPPITVVPSPVERWAKMGVEESHPTTTSEGGRPASVHAETGADADEIGSAPMVTSQRTSLGSTSSEPMRRAPGVQSPSSSDAASLAPSESASYPADARAQGQVAIRALIHNLRLDEKESIHRAKQLEAVEADMKAQQASGLPSEEVKPPQPLASSPETWGRSFQVEWIRVQPLDFQRVRRLRNPWRDNRQIKVSRDGTELEPNAGRQLLEEWAKAEEQVQRAVASAGDTRSPALSTADEEEEENE